MQKKVVNNSKSTGGQKMTIKNKIILGFTCAIMALTLGASHSFAGTTCNAATITSAYASSAGSSYAAASAYRITATCDNRWTTARNFYITKGDSAEAAYATALTAMSLGHKVSLRLAGSGTANSLCHSITLLAN